MRTTAFFLLAICASFLSSCSEDSATPGSYTIKNIFPLSVGSKWELQVLRYDSLGAVVDLDTAEVRVDKDTTYQGIPGYKTFAFDDYQILYYSGDNLWRIGIGATMPDFMLRYPIAAGEVYVIEDTTTESGDRTRNTIRILSESEKTTVPAGTFDCIKYELLRMYGDQSNFDTSSLLHVFFSPNTGYIRENFITRTGKIYKSHQLLKYTK
jgi:hypothetical protein